MRIAIVTETWLPSINGVVTRLVATVRELLARDHMVMLVCPTVAEPPGGVANPPGAAVCHVPSVGLPFIYGGQPWGLPLPRVMRLLDGFRPDLVHAVCPFLLGWAGVLHTRSRGLPRCLYVGRLAAEKGIEALLPLAASGGERHLALVGGGPAADDLAQALAGTQATLAGTMAGTELAAAYASADVFVFPSTTDTLGLVLLEAMASGLPVVAARTQAAEDLLARAPAGGLFDSGDPVALTEALAGSGPEIVIGSEVSSRDGHVLALFVTCDIRPGMSAEATIGAIHEQGGLAVAAHPYSLAEGVGDLAPLLPFDGVEILNGSPLMEMSNARAAARLARATSCPGWRIRRARRWGGRPGVHPLFLVRERPTCGPHCSRARLSRRSTGRDAWRRCPFISAG